MSKAGPGSERIRNQTMCGALPMMRKAVTAANAECPEVVCKVEGPATSGAEGPEEVLLLYQTP